MYWPLAIGPETGQTAQRAACCRTSREADQIIGFHASPSALVWIDQVFLAGRALGVSGDMIELERLWQGHHLRIMTGKGGLEFIDHALAQLRSFGRPDFLQKWKQQPAADAPSHSECPIQDDGAR